MKTIFNTAILIQVLMMGAYMLLVLMTPDNLWLKLISWCIFTVGMFIFASIMHYTNHNDIFKTIKELEYERDQYKSAKKKYLNAQIDKVEGFHRK